MCRARWLVVMGLLLLPAKSSALRLHWNSGATNLDFTEATRCTLVVEADSTGGTLPAETRLLWVADSASVAFIALDSLTACQEDTAEVKRINGPETPADSSANLITAYFCSAGANGPPAADYVLDLTAGAHGKLKVVALDPDDSTKVIESNEVTFNGGVEGDYPPAILGAYSIHESITLQVTAVGAGLRAVSSLSLAAPDSSWILPLNITRQSGSEATATARTAALLPASVVRVASSDGAVTSLTIPADKEPTEPLSGMCMVTYHEDLLEPPPGLGFAILPKDFAFVRGFVDTTAKKFVLHLFYLRASLYKDVHTGVNIGHCWTADFESWCGTPDTVAIVARPDKFDRYGVWAPTIVQHGPTFYMFYTGVDSTLDNPSRHHQRIGVATSTDLDSWTQVDSVVLSCPSIPWASKNPPATFYDGQQLRDPFVMADPLHSGQWLMYFVAVDSAMAPKMAVGVARSADLRTWVADQGPLRSTERATFQGGTQLVESPHVFGRNGQWWLAFTVDNPNMVFFETNTHTDPTDRDSTHWVGPVWLRGVTYGTPSDLEYWHATEYLKVNQIEYLAAFDDNATGIDIAQMFPVTNPDSVGVDSIRLTCPGIAGVDHPATPPGAVRLVVTRMRWGSSEVGFRVELPSRMAARLAVYDVAGRRRATILDGVLPAGSTVTTWSGRDQTGARIASGVYFVRLTCAKGARVSKVVLVR
jgi:hypothetical protein